MLTEVDKLYRAGLLNTLPQCLTVFLGNLLNLFKVIKSVVKEQ